MLRLALVGRPNVGKSTLFNRICKKRIAIEHEEEGVTRDRIYADADFFGKSFTLVDTGGIDSHSDLPFFKEIKTQALIAIQEADAIIMVVDGKTGSTVLDEEVAKLLLRSKKNVTLAVNKIDMMENDDLIHQFHSLGLSKIIGVSASQGYKIAELLEMTFQDVHFVEKEVKKGPSIVIVGRPNVGKSTFLNFLFQEERAIVSDIAGTTRDAVDIILEKQEKFYTFIDTAGLKKKKSEKTPIEKFAAIRTEKNIEKADICLLMLDARMGLTAEEKRIACMIEKKGKGCILLFNKWDLVTGCRMEHCLMSIRKEVPFLKHCPTRFISAKTGRNIEGILSEIDVVFEFLGKRVSTGELNRFIEKCMQRYHPPMITGKRLRIYYLSQIETHPPRFTFFVNRPALMIDAYKKYLINKFREEYIFSGAPLHFFLKGKPSKRKSIKALGEK